MDTFAGFQQRRAGAVTHRFRMIGRFKVEPIDFLPNGRKARALLAYVALARDAVERDKLAALLWSERGDQQAHASLRQCLIELRTFTKGMPPLLRVDRHRISLDKSVSSTDLCEILVLAGLGDAAGVLELLPHSGELLLEGLDGLDPAYDEWLSIERASWLDQIDRAVIACGEKALAAGDSKVVRSLAGRLAEFDPVNEAAARLEMAAAAQSGDRDGVRRVWHRIESALASELAVRPAEETAALFKHLIEAPVVRPVEATVEPEMPERKLSLSARSGMRLLVAVTVAAGLALAAGLLPHPDPSVAEAIAFEQALPSGGGAAADKTFASLISTDFQQMSSAIGRDISILDTLPSKTDRSYPDLLVRTRVSRSSEQTDGLVQLVSSRNNVVLWSGNYSNDMDDLSGLGLRAAGGLITALRCALRSLPASDPFRDEKRAQLVFSACGAVFEESGQPFVRAEALARRLVERNPELSIGWALLAAAELERLRFGPEEIAQQSAASLIKRARGHALRSLRLDPRNGGAYSILSETLDPFESPRTLDFRLRVLEAGLRADPDNPELLISYGIQLFNGGYAMSAVAPAQKALSLDPTSPFKSGVVVRRLMSAGMVAEAFAAQLRSERISPNDNMVKIQRLRMMCEQGDPQAAMALYAKLTREQGYPPQVPAMWPAVLKWRLDPASFDPAQMESEARKALALEPEAANYVAAAFARVGEIDRAFHYLELAPVRYSQHSILFWPEAEPMRRDPRFFGFMNRIGLVDVWVRRGRWPDFCSESGLRYDCSEEAAKLGKLLRRS